MILVADKVLATKTVTAKGVRRKAGTREVLATKAVTAKGVRRKAGTCEAMWAAAAVNESAAAAPNPTAIPTKGRCPNPCPQRAQGNACEAHDYLFSHDVLI